MKTNNNFFLISGCIALILVCAVIVAGCTSSTTPAKSDSSAAPSTAIPVATVQAPVQTPAIIVATSTQVPTTTASLSNGVTITYPSDWEKKETSETSLRDYGRTTTNIANFFSPDITSERATSAYPNVDKSKYTSLSIDVDPNPVKDFENYFNQVTLALGTNYKHFDITKHNYQLSISKTDTLPGYKSYQMDFDTDNMRGTYIFTNVDGTIYIFAFKNPSPYSAEVHEIWDSIKILPNVVSTQKQR